MKIRKIALLLILAGTLICASVSFSFADMTAKGTSFKQAWTKSITKTEPGGIRHILAYGYNTFLIHEDICYAYSNGYYHRAQIKNGNGTHNGPPRWANEGWSDLEVRHKGSTVTYINDFL
jgi:hypothetical protein